MKPLILGEAPGRLGDPALPIGGAIARRLCEFAGFVSRRGDDPWRTALAFRFDLANLLDEWPGPQASKGAAFPTARACEQLIGLYLGERPVVILGRRLAGSLGVRETFYRWRDGRVVIPHPSGIVRAYNDPDQRALAGRCLRSAIRRAR